MATPYHVAGTLSQRLVTRLGSSLGKLGKKDRTGSNGPILVGDEYSLLITHIFCGRYYCPVLHFIFCISIICSSFL